MNFLSRTSWSIGVLVILGIALVMLAHHNFRRRDNVAATRIELATAIESLHVGAAIGTDHSFNKYKQEKNIISQFIAPKGLRSLAQPPEMQTWSRIYIGFRWDEGRVSLFWKGNLRVLGSQAEAERKLMATIEQGGYRDATDKLTTHLSEEYKAINKHLMAFQGENNPKRKDLDWPWAFARNAGSTKEELLIHAFGGGGGKQSGGDFEWCVATAYRDAAPKLQDLLETFPALNPVHLEPALYQILRREPAYAFSTDCLKHRPGVAPNLGWRLVTSATVRPDLEAVLEREGFVPDRQMKLPQEQRYGERTQFIWKRSSDLNFASLITQANDKERIQVSCQTPHEPVKP